MASKVITAKSGTVIEKCTCHSEYQDQKYGKGNRVYNVGPKGKTCTVCGKRKVL